MVGAGGGEEPSRRLLLAYGAIAAVLFLVGAVAGEQVRALVWIPAGLIGGIALVTLLWSRVRPDIWHRP